MSVGRNEPCPCGSAKKYKRCCGAATSAATVRPSALHELDAALVSDMLRWVKSKRISLAAAHDAFPYEIGTNGDQNDAQLVAPWLAYVWRGFDGGTLADAYREARGAALDERQSGWLLAQHEAFFSPRRIASTRPGLEMELECLFTGQRALVHDVASSRAPVGAVMLTRLVDFAGETVACGTHPVLHLPLRGHEVAERLREAFAREVGLPRTGPLSAESLRDDEIAWQTIATWQEAVEAEREPAVPALHNTDGDPLLLTTDELTFEPSARAEVVRRIEAIEGIEDDGEGGYKVVRRQAGKPASWQNTVVGALEIDRARLRLLTNSIPRADALRSRVEAALGNLGRHRARSHSDLEGMMRRGGADPIGAPLATPEEAFEVIRQSKAQHYADWMDRPLPALGGRTPRAASKTTDGKRALRALIDDIDSRESRLPAAERFDFTPIRRELGIIGG